MIYALTVLILSIGAPQEGSQSGVWVWYATWCGPCRTQETIISKWAASKPTLNGKPLTIWKTDIDKSRELAHKWSIRVVPTLIIVIDNKAVRRIEGITSESTLNQIFKQYERR